MTAVALPELDLTRLRHAVERLDLPNVDLPRLDLDRLDLEGARRDLGRMRSSLGNDIAKFELDVPRVDLPHLDLPHVDLPHVNLPDLDQLLGRKRRSPGPSGGVLVGVVALLAGLVAGAVLAYFLNPSKGARRRRSARRRLGRIKRRVLG